jgi:hypothetical protein
VISPDAPILHVEEDRLDRAPFAKALARAISAHEDEESFVVAINGKWGSGKSSVLNLCVDELRGTPTGTAQGVDILKFNPWNFADQHQLIHQFFRQLAGYLRQFDKNKGIKGLIESIDAYAEALGPPIEAIPVAKAGLPWAKAVVRLAGKRLGLAQDLESLQTSIAQQLKELKRKIVVIIDDIDRLTAEESRQIFQLVKISARFPNVVYVLAFDRAAVASAIARSSGIESGDEYLEKIVQVSFDLPPITESTLTSLISEALRRLRDKYPAGHFDEHRFETIVSSGFRKCFESLRDVNRFANGLEFGFGLIASEVNASDFIGVESIRIFHPKLYEAIRRNKTLFSGTVDTLAQKSGSQAFREAVEAAMNDDSDHEQVKDLVIELFPKLKFAYSNILYGADSETEWEGDLRVASSRYFDVYFQLSLPSDEVSTREIDDLMKRALDKIKFTESLESFLKSGRIVNAVSSIRHRLASIPSDALSAVLASFLDVGDNLKQSGSPLFGEIPQFWHLRWAIFDVLDRMPQGTREPVLSELFGNTSGVGTAANITALLEIEVAQKPDRFPDLNQQVLRGLKHRIAQRIDALSKTEPLEDREAFGIILGAWRQWGEPERAKAYVRAILDDPVRAIVLLDKFVVQSRSASSGERTVKVTNRLSCKDLSDFIDLRHALATTREISTSDLSQRQKEIVAFVTSELEEFERSGLTPEEFDGRRKFAF